MATMRLPLPDEIMEWVEGQTSTGGYGEAADYVRELIVREKERAEKLAELQALITEGVESGVSPRSMEEILESARQQAGGARDHAL
jgi:antitoxin ParD1/3/4